MRSERLPRCPLQLPTSPVHTSRSLPGSVAPTINLGADIKSPSRSLPSRGPTSRDFVPWRFLDACQLSALRLSLLPASKNLHNCGHRLRTPISMESRAGDRTGSLDDLLRFRGTCRTRTFCLQRGGDLVDEDDQ